MDDNNLNDAVTGAVIDLAATGFLLCLLAACIVLIAIANPQGTGTLDALFWPAVGVGTLCLVFIAQFAPQTTDHKSLVEPD